jgi:NAD(P)-dependent dehydrogenase (short-subunit alcohol dehydrogenase family)
MAKSLDGKVALVTGAGQGLGRAEALYLASEGAKVVVNDLGATVEGEGKESKPAQAVVEEIKAAGGEAVAHGGDVSSYDDAKEMIDLAIKEFGDFHILINNAGILRDRMIFNITEGEWDAVVKVHLKGHFNTTRHACAHWREQSKVSGSPAYGRIVNTSSEAFLMGSPGQPNYAAAKAGIVGLTTSTAQAMHKYGVTSNAIAPRAATRMTEMFGMDPELFAPENVAPLVGFLASPEAERVSGQLFVVWGNQVSLLAPLRIEEKFETEGRWDFEGLSSSLVPYFDKREPVTDGFIVKY